MQIRMCFVIDSLTSFYDRYVVRLPWIATAEIEPALDVRRVLRNSLRAEPRNCGQGQLCAHRPECGMVHFKTMETHAFFKSKSNFSVLDCLFCPFQPFWNWSARALQDGRRWQSRSHRVSGGGWNSHQKKKLKRSRSCRKGHGIYVAGIWRFED